MQIGILGHQSTHLGGPRQQDHGSMNVHIFNNLHARQKWNDKKAFNRMKKKTKLKWDELQTQAQQME
jgi:hypothetical protein